MLLDLHQNRLQKLSEEFKKEQEIIKQEFDKERLITHCYYSRSLSSLCLHDYQVSLHPPVNISNCFLRQAIIAQHKQEITDIQDIIFAMEQENQEQDIEMKQEFQSYRDEIKNKVCFCATLPSVSSLFH
jgi:hypothetical protein